jgi:RimJ/RimL family protein N-acetyltransferase
VVILETSRLVLRTFVPDDVDALARVLSDPQTMRYYPAPFDRPGVADWIARNQRRYDSDGHGLWATVLKATGELTGDCGLVRQYVDGHSEIEIGYHTRRDLWGQGLATEAARACCDWGFQNLAVHRLISLIRPENLPSRRVAEKCGMQVSKQVLWRDVPHLVYSITRDRASQKM